MTTDSRSEPSAAPPADVRSTDGVTPATMRAVKHDRYGSYDVLEVRQVPVPKPAEGEVLVRIDAAGIHVGDCFGVLGSPLPVRMATGLLRPKDGIPGYDFSGVVEAVGPDVTDFEPGDEVIGAHPGSCAEYICAPAGVVAPRPDALSHTEAAALPTSGLAALHGLRDAGQLAAGQRVLINGASGGVGTYAVQIAKAMGAHVTGVCSTRNVEMVKALGADEVIDYKKADFTRGDARYDLIFDNVENHELSDLRRVLTDRGTLILNSGTGAVGLKMVTRLLKPLILSPFVRHDLKRFLSTPNADDLQILAKMADEGKLEPVLDRTVPLDETADALRYIGEGHAQGKVVVHVTE